MGDGALFREAWNDECKLHFWALHDTKRILVHDEPLADLSKVHVGQGDIVRRMIAEKIRRIERLVSVS